MLLAGLIVFAVCVYFLHEFQASRNAAAFILQADRLEAEGQLKQAATYLSRYLGYVPTNAAILARYARLLDDLADSPKARGVAVQALERALRREPRDTELRHRVARALTNLHQYGYAAKHLEILLQFERNNVDSQELLGECYASQGEIHKSVAMLEKAVKQDPTRIAAYTKLATVLHDQLDQGQRAAQVLDSMSAANAQCVPAHLARARFWTAHGAYAKAGKDLEIAAHLSPANPDILFEETELARHTGWRDDLRIQLEDALKAHPRDERLYVALARLELSCGKRESGLATLRRGLQVAPAQSDLLAMLAETRIQDGLLDEAASVVTRLQKGGGAPEIANYLQSLILIRKQKYAAAAAILESIRPRVSTWPELACQAELELAQCYDRLGNLQQKAAAQRRAVANNPRSAAARYALASTFLALGQFEETANELRQCVALPDAPKPCWALLAQALMQRNLQLTPAKRDWKAVEESLAQAETAEPGSVPVTILRANMLAARDKSDEARKLLEREIAAKPDVVALWIGLAELLQRNGQPDAAWSILTQTRQRAGDDLPVRLAMARYWSRHSDPQAAQALAALGRDVEKFPVEYRVEFLRELAESAFLAGDFTDAEAFCRKVIELLPADKRSRLLLFDVALQTGRAAQLDKILGELRAIEGENGALWKCGDAARLLLLAGRGQKTAARDARLRLTEVSIRYPEWPYVALLEGALDEIEGNEGSAIEHYLQAVDKGDLRPRVLFRAAELLERHHRYGEAQQIVRKLEAQVPLTGRFARLGAQIAVHVNEPARALQLAERALPAKMRDYRDDLWLAGIQEAAGNLVAARETFRKATERGRNIPDTWAALVEFIGRTESPEKAKAILREVQAHVVPERVPLTLARCYEAMGEPQHAEAEYLLLLRQRPVDISALYALASLYLRNEQPEKAEPYLRRLLDPKSIAPFEQIVWARRKLAVALIAGQAPSGYEEARRLIEANLQINNSSPEDERLRAFMLGMQPGKQRQAVRLIEETRQRQPLTLDEQIRLAQLYDAAGERGKAREQYLGLMAMERPDPGHIEMFTRFLARQGEVSEAWQWLGRLEKLEPGTPRTAAARVFVLEKQQAPSTEKK